MNFPKSKIFLICCIVFLVGIAVASFLPNEWILNDIWWFGGIVGSLVMAVLFWSSKKIRLASLLGLFLFLGLWRYAVSLPVNTPDKIWYYNGRTVSVVGVVTNEPDIRKNNQKLEIKARRLSLQEGDLASFDRGVDNISGKILVTTNLYPSYNYGDELAITCQLQKPEQFQGFAYDRYLARYDIYSVCYYPRLRPVCLSAEQDFGGQARSSNCEAKNSGNWFYKNIFSFKDKLREIMDYGLSEPEASLGRAIILGDKKGISGDLRQKFSQAGISHIVAISGMHISILAALVLSLLVGLGVSRKYSFMLASIFLIIYIFLIGLPASAMRAGLMGFLVLWALHLGRLNKLTNSLILAASLLLLVNPKLLRDDIGWQLSFLAVLGIAYGFPIIENWLDKIKIPKMKGMRSILSITLAAQVLTLPIIAFNFSQVSIIAPISNLLILWTLPILMIANLVALGISLILPSLAFLFFLPAWILLKYIIAIADWLTKLPYAYVEIDYLWWGWVIIYYGAVLWLWRYFQETKKAEK